MENGLYLESVPLFVEQGLVGIVAGSIAGTVMGKINDFFDHCSSQTERLVTALAIPGLAEMWRSTIFSDSLPAYAYIAGVAAGTLVTSQVTNRKIDDWHRLESNYF